jgi:hypothetical protein
MAFTEGGLSAADVLALNGNNNSRNGLFGDDLIGLIALAAVFGGGFGGFGGFGGWGGGGAGLQGVVTRADINEGFALQNILGGIQAIQQGICDSTYALTGTMTSGFHGVEKGFWDISRQLGDCCCENRAAIADLKYTVGQQGCETRNAMYINTRDIIDNQNANYRGLMDFMVQEKLASKDAIIADLKMQVSQGNQNAVIGARIDAAVAEILRRTGAECPTPAYLVNAPTPVNFPVNSCGQVQFASPCGCGC